ncbi:DUF309 domain-containing protein [Tateyamaria sp.]|uniref:DUF309 domain-containing protein n=1 Tax=Tateyamaria sp. TaxID=1929288 RepID=UPI003B21E938
MSDFRNPPHAYVPGQTIRHPEGLFDPLKVGIHNAMTEDEMQSSLAWRAGIRFRDDGFYWECHEVLEALWLATPDGALRNYVQAVIQLANAQLKSRMDRPKAVRRLCMIVQSLLDECEGRTMILGQNVERLRAEACALQDLHQNKQ